MRMMRALLQRGLLLAQSYRGFVLTPVNILPKMSRRFVAYPESTTLHSVEGPAAPGCDGGQEIFQNSILE